MAGQRILLTGASSFTGCHIARALLDRGHEVLAPMTRPAGEYRDGIVADRLRHATGLETIFEAPFGSEIFRESIRRFAPDVLVNHGADIRGYRDPSFDPKKAFESATRGLDAVLSNFHQSGGKHVVHTGTVFEPIDGLPAHSPYGQAKTLVAEAFEHSARDTGLSFTKILIANPAGPFENEDRLIPNFVRAWKGGKRPTLNMPNIVWDNVPAPWLARRYAEAIESKTFGILRPSGYTVLLKAFVDLFVEQAKRRGVAGSFGIDIPADAPPTPPHPRLNTKPCPELSRSDEVDAFFDFWISSFWPEAKKVRS